MNRNEQRAVDKTIAKVASASKSPSVASPDNMLKLYRAIISRNPPRSIVKQHQFGNFDYIPITAIERLFDGMFPGWSVEIKREGIIANGFYTVVTLSLPVPRTDHAGWRAGCAKGEI